MEQLWDGVKSSKRKELLSAIYGNTLNYMVDYSWGELPYGVQKRLEKLKEMFDKR